jgi:hydroxyacylglutathione hydrolase
LMTWSIHPLFNNNSLSNITYMLEVGDGEFICLDPFRAPNVVEWLSARNGHLSAVLNTHEHWDHIGGNEELKSFYGCEIWAHANAAEKIPGVDRRLQEGDELFQMGKNKLSVLHTPGHSPGHLCLIQYQDEKMMALFSGDTIFNGGVGNCKNGGDPQILYSTIAKILLMIHPEATLYPGHDYLENNLAFARSILPATNCSVDNLFKTIAQEREYNLFFRLNDLELKKALGKMQESEKEMFLELRRRRDRW